MLEKIVGMKVELKPITPKENEKLCDTCGGTGWLYNNENGYIIKCRNCYDGVIHLCPICKAEVRGACMSDGCVNRRFTEKEQANYNKAIKVNIEDVPPEHVEMLYSESYGYNDGYFNEFEELIDFCKDAEVEIPEYVWSTTKMTLSMDAASIIENACEELHEDAYQNINGEKELQEFLDAWCAKQSGTDSYMVDYKYAIKVDVD
jgi:hypothetical protein